jgi:hypothetical protein
MVTILPALQQVREDLVKHFDRNRVERICRELGHTWRAGQLDPYTTLHLFILQVLHQNTAMTHLPHLAGEQFTASAYCQARQRLPVEFFSRLVDSFTRGAASADGQGRWRGHRVLLTDGSTFSMPDTAELRAHFGQPAEQKPGCGFPVAHLLALLDVHTGLLREVIVAPLNTHDMAHVARLHPHLSPGDIVVGDRGFCSYAHLALLSQAHLHGVLRVHQRQIVSFHPHRPCANDIDGTGHPTSRWLYRQGRCDQVVEWRKPQTRPQWMSAAEFAALPETLVVREIKWRIRERGRRVREVTLVTTLLDAELYPAEEIAKLYESRWQIEVDLRDLKATLGLDVLKGTKVATVEKELLVYVLVYNLIRLVMVEAAERQNTEPQRISFIDALRWLQPGKPVVTLPRLIVNPRRTDRIEPRCRKRRPKNYPLMTKPRRTLRKLLKKRRDAA